MMRYNGVIHRKFALLDKYLLEFQKHMKGVKYHDFKNDWVLQRMTERSLQVMVEIVIDISERILALNNAGPAATAKEAIEKLVTLGALKSASPFAKMVQFRNMVVHQYEEIDPKLLYAIATKHLNDFRRFRKVLDRG